MSVFTNLLFDITVTFVANALCLVFLVEVYQYKAMVTLTDLSIHRKQSHIDVGV